MLQRILGVHRDDLTIETLRGLTGAQQPEGQSLEFIRDLPGSTDQGQVDFLREVVGMVNGGGGILIYGISDHGGKADQLVGVPLKGVDTKFRQLIIDRVEPTIRFEIITVAVTPQAGCMVVELPTSSRAPHLLKIKGTRYEYPTRVGTDRRYMSPSEVAQRFRTQFTRLEELSKSLDDRIDRVVTTRYSDQPYARAYVAAIPVEDHGRLFTVIDSWRTRTIDRPAPFLGGYPVLHAEARPVFQAVQFIPGYGPIIDELGIMELGADGSFVQVIPSQMPVGAHPGNDRRHPEFTDTELAGYLIGGIEGLHALHHHFNVTGPLKVVYGIAPDHLPAELKPAQGSGRHVTYEAGPLTHPVQGQFDVMIQGTSPIDRTRTLAKVILDDLFSAFGWSGCQLINHDGSLSWSDPYRSHGDDWNEEQTQA